MNRRIAAAIDISQKLNRSFVIHAHCNRVLKPRYFGYQKRCVATKIPVRPDGISAFWRSLERKQIIWAFDWQKSWSFVPQTNAAITIDEDESVDVLKKIMIWRNEKTEVAGRKFSKDIRMWTEFLLMLRGKKVRRGQSTALEEGARLTDYVDRISWR